MRRSLAFHLCLVVFLCACTTAETVVIEDFESYQWPTPPLWPWEDISPGPSSADLTILDGDASQGNYAGTFGFDIAGGWQDPADSSDYEIWDSAGMRREFDPIDFEPGGEIHFHIRLEYGWDISKVDYLSIEWSGDSFAQTWLAGPAFPAGVTSKAGL